MSTRTRTEYSVPLTSRIFGLIYRPDRSFYYAPEPVFVTWTGLAQNTDLNWTVINEELGL